MSNELTIGLLSGLGGALAGGIITLIATYLTLRRSGSQKIAESRMQWNELHRKLSVDLHRALRKIGRHNVLPAIADQEQAVALATEILLIINPDGSGESAQAERRLESDLLQRLSDVGLTVDMPYVRLHRAVLKHAWRTAKAEF